MYFLIDGGPWVEERHDFCEFGEGDVALSAQIPHELLAVTHAFNTVKVLVQDIRCRTLLFVFFCVRLGLLLFFLFVPQKLSKVFQLGVYVVLISCFFDLCIRF